MAFSAAAAAAAAVSDERFAGARERIEKSKDDNLYRQ